jgi:hypothetical protein
MALATPREVYPIWYFKLSSGKLEFYYYGFLGAVGVPDSPEHIGPGLEMASVELDVESRLHQVLVGVVVFPNLYLDPFPVDV